MSLHHYKCFASVGSDTGIHPFKSSNATLAMTLKQAHYKGNENIGFYGVLTDAYAVFAREFKMATHFDDPLESSLGDTALVGLFAAGNSDCLVVPDIIGEYEQSQLDEAGIPYHVLEGRFTALGNLILANDHGAVVSPHLEDRTDELEDALGVPVTVSTVAGLEITGSCGVATNNGVLLHRDATESELSAIEDALGVEGDIGTVNFGGPYVHSGLLVNSETVLVGQNTTGPEIQRIQDALGFL